MLLPAAADVYVPASLPALQAKVRAQGFSAPQTPAPLPDEYILRVGVTPSLIARYTTGQSLGAKAFYRIQIAPLWTAVSVNVAASNGGTISALDGPRNDQSQPGVRQEALGFDARVAFGFVELRGELIRLTQGAGAGDKVNGLGVQTVVSRFDVRGGYGQLGLGFDFAVRRCARRVRRRGLARERLAAGAPEADGVEGRREIGADGGGRQAAAAVPAGQVRKAAAAAAGVLRPGELDKSVRPASSRLCAARRVELAAASLIERGTWPGSVDRSRDRPELRQPPAHRQEPGARFGQYGLSGS